MLIDIVTGRFMVYSFLKIANFSEDQDVKKGDFSINVLHVGK